MLLKPQSDTGAQVIVRGRMAGMGTVRVTAAAVITMREEKNAALAGGCARDLWDWKPCGPKPANTRRRERRGIMKAPA